MGTSIKCCIRFEKRNKAGLVQMRLHDQRRHGEYDHVDSLRSHLNEQIIGTADLVADCEARAAAFEAKTDKRTTHPFIHGIVATSPEYFRDPGMKPGEWNQLKYEGWRDACVEHLITEFGDNLVNVSADLDEDTPTLDFYVTPVTSKVTKRGVSHWLSPGKVLNPDGGKGYGAHQDRLAAALEHLGITRGEVGSKAKHERPKAYQTRIAKEQKATEAQLQQSANDVEERTKIVEAKEAGMNGVVNGEILPVTSKGNKSIKLSDKLEPDAQLSLFKRIEPVLTWVIEFAHRWVSGGDHATEIHPMVKEIGDGLVDAMGMGGEEDNISVRDLVKGKKEQRVQDMLKDWKKPKNRGFERGSR